MDIRPVSNASASGQLTFDRPAAIGVSIDARIQAASSVELTTAVEQPVTVPSLPELGKAVQSINNTLSNLSQNLEFSVDENSNRTIVKVVDQQSGQVLRQLPSKEVLEIAKALDRLQGLLISQKV